MRRHGIESAIAALIVAGLSVACGARDADSGKASRRISSASALDIPADALASANHLVEGQTGALPDLVTVWQTTLDKAEAVTDAAGSLPEPVYLFWYQGDFTARYVGAPPVPGQSPSPPPHGRFAVVIVSAADGEVRTWGVQNSPVDESIVGPPSGTIRTSP
jgi:hypothetical protein